MAGTYIVAGANLLQERPKLEKRFKGLIGGDDILGESLLKGVALDTRNNILWVAGDTNKRIYNVNKEDASVVVSYPYPEGATACYGITMDYRATKVYIMFLGDLEGRLQLVRLEATTDETLDELVEVERYYLIKDERILWSSTYTGLTRKGFRYYTIGGQQGNIVYEMNDTGQLLRSYTTSSYTCGITYTNKMFYVGTNTTVGSGYLTKHDDTFAESTNLAGIDPFLLNGFKGDLDNDKDTMWVVNGKNLYKYSMIYYVFLIDDEPYDDIDLGIVKSGGEKIQKVMLKNIADYYVLDDITISVVNDPNNDADDMITVSNEEKGVYGTAVSIAGSVGIDGEMAFYVKCKPPADASKEGNPRVAKLQVACKVY